MANNLMEQLKAELNEEEYIALLEHFAGCRLYIAAGTEASRSLPTAIGKAGAEKLVRILGNATIRVPLDREARIRHYAAKGLSAPLIAVRLGITENGVHKALTRYGLTGARRRALTKWRRGGGTPLITEVNEQMRALKERASREF